MSDELNTERSEDRRSNTRGLIDKLLEERAKMLVLYCRAAGLDADPPGDSVAKTVQEFCQLLVDYIAAGHFTLYERIVNGEERRQRVAEVADDIYPDIAETTGAALDFNDKYEHPENVSQDEQLADDLSVLGEQLAARIELEDKLIRLLR
jgi:regulator of sigma D